jgi:hypothetical protein
MAVLVDENTEVICQGHHASVRMTRGISSRGLPFQIGPGQPFDGLMGNRLVLASHGASHGKLETIANVPPERRPVAKMPERLTEG